MDLNEYRDIFINEAQEHLGAFNEYVLRLEKNHQDSEALSSLFRAAHTLKGMAATMGFDGITELSHEMENVLEALRSGAMAVSQPLMDILFSCIDALSKMIGDVASGGTAQQLPQELLNRLKALAEGRPETAGAPKPPAALREAPAASTDKELMAQAQTAWLQGKEVFQVVVTIEAGCPFQGVRAFMVVRNLEKMGRILKTYPVLSVLETGAFERVFTVWLASEEGASEVQEACLKVLEVAETKVAVLEKEGAGPAPVRLAPPVLPPSGAAAPAAGDEKAEAEAKTALEAGEKPAGEAASKQAVKQSVRVQVERLDNLMNLVGELVTHKIRLAQISKTKQVRELKDSLAELERVINEMQDEVMSIRMVPMDTIFNRFPRMVRDLAKELGKEVELVLEGKEIECDRTLLEEISDPLVHLLRNALDHGLETPEQRKKAGKPVLGLLRLTARREKNQVLIMVEDDGKGFDPVLIKQVAIRKGLLNPDQAAHLTETEIINLTTLPGFSTAEKITNLSGRGVGLDVVKTKLESFGGTFRIESQAGKGTKFNLRLPLTLAIIQALLIRLGREIYAVPVTNAIEAVEYTAADLKRMQNQEIILLREQILPVVRLAQLLEVPGTPHQTPDLFTVLIVESADRKVGLMVDEVMGQQEIAIKNLGPFLKGIRGFGGVTVLGDGRIALILDIPTLL